MTVYKLTAQSNPITLLVLKHTSQALIDLVKMKAGNL